MSFSECSRVQLINCEHIVSNITFTFPFSAHRSAGWAGKKDSPTMRQHSSKQIDVHCHSCCYILHNKPHTHNNEFIPLASPVESSEIRATCSARPTNIDHIFSHQTLEQTTITVIHPGRFDIKSTSVAPARLLSCSMPHISF